MDGLEEQVLRVKLLDGTFVSLPPPVTDDNDTCSTEELRQALDAVCDKVGLNREIGRDEYSFEILPGGEQARPQSSDHKKLPIKTEDGGNGHKTD